MNEANTTLVREKQGAKRDMTAVRKEVRRGLDAYMGVRLLIIAIVFCAGTMLSLWVTIWFGVAIGCLLGIGAVLYYINSTRYVRDAWATETEITKAREEDKGQLDYLAMKRTAQRDYQEVDRNFGIAFLTLSLIVLALTTVIAIIEGQP